MNSHAEAALSRPSVSRRAVASRSASMGSTSAASPSRPPSVDSGSRPDLPKRARFARSYRRVALSHTRGCERECRGAVRACLRRGLQCPSDFRRDPLCDCHRYVGQHWAFPSFADSTTPAASTEHRNDRRVRVTAEQGRGRQVPCSAGHCAPRALGALVDREDHGADASCSEASVTLRSASRSRAAPRPRC